jgi:hypothetical protein
MFVARPSVFAVGWACAPCRWLPFRRFVRPTIVQTHFCFWPAEFCLPHSLPKPHYWVTVFMQGACQLDECAS